MNNDLTTYKKSENEELFGLVKIDGRVKIAIGNNIVSQHDFETFEEAEEYIKNKPYELIINATALLLKYENINIKESGKDTENNG